MPSRSARSKTGGNNVIDGSKAQSKDPPAKIASKVIKRKTPNDVWEMHPPLPLGEILMGKIQQWKLGSSIGKGGFGEIYSATPISATNTKTYEYAIKIESYESASLSYEVAFYKALADAKSVSKWRSSHKLEYIGIPLAIDWGHHYLGSSNETKYRFLVIERYGDDIEKLFCKAGRIFTIKTVCYLALRMMEALEYLHESRYTIVHADIKGTNIVTGLTPDTKHQVYLIDYGLSNRYSLYSKHRDYEPNPERCHEGTLPFTSIDAHNGANPSRRGDMEILGYCLLQWACGRLPWEDHLEDKPKVADMKTKYKSLPVSDLMKDCFKDKPISSCLSLYMQKVYRLSYEEKPPYEDMKKMFLKELQNRKLKDNKEGLDWMEGGKKRVVLKTNSVEIETNSQLSPPKRRKTVAEAKTQEVIEEVPKRSNVSQKDTIKTKGEEIHESKDSCTKTSKQNPLAVEEDSTTTAERLPTRACKIAARARILSYYTRRR